MRFPQQFIDDLRRQADIVSVIQSYVSLKKKGNSWMACCPFHKEKTPSFSVNPNKDIFYCFGCSKGGSVFKFVMELEGVGFPEAVRIVAEKAGVALPALQQTRPEEIGIADRIIQLNGTAMEWWQAELLRSPEAGRYLEERQISAETVKTFRIGYAPDTWEGLASQLRSAGASQLQLDNSGLVVKKDEGGCYDRFRGRLMIPIMDQRGRPIAFGGRALSPGETAKYINSPETDAYIKGQHLFGLNLAAPEIRKQGFAILVEGFLDLVVPFQHGIRNMVASLGTSLTEEQAKLLARLTKKVIINYDGDAAGLRAALRAIDILLAEDFEVKVLVLPSGSDPDAFVRQFGAAEYHHRRSKAQSHIQFVIDRAVSGRDLLRPAEKADAVDLVLPCLRAVKSALQKREYFDIAMEALRVEDKGLLSEFWRAVRDGDTPNPQASGPREELNPTLAEKRLLELMIGDEAALNFALESLPDEETAGLATGPLFTAVRELNLIWEEPGYDNLLEKLGEGPLADLLPSLLFPDLPEGDALLRETAQCINAILLLNAESNLTELNRTISTTKRLGKEGLDELLAEQTTLIKYRHTLLKANQ